MKPLVIYHANCADGFGAAFAAWTVLGDEAEYVAASYNEEVAFSGTWNDRDVYILDFSFKKPVMDEFFAHAKRVVWLDHHKTAFEMWCGEYEKGMRYSDTNGCYEDGNHDILLDDNRSGAMIAWNWFHGAEIPMLIKHIDDYDRWVFAIEGTKAFNKALWSRAPWSFEQWDIWAKQQGGSLEWTKLEGSAILRAHDQNVQSVVKGAARKCDISFPVALNPGVFGGGLQDCFWQDTGLAANCPPHLTSDVGHELAVRSGTFGLCWTLANEGLIAKCSIRSNGEYDVSDIAKALGGGGHRNAAGFEVPIETLLGWMK